MRRVLPTLIAIAAIAFSCQKELQEFPSNPPIIPPTEPPVNVDSSNLIDSMKGDWNFVNITAATQSSTEFNILGVNRKTVAVLNYNTQNNGGTVTITDSMIHAVGITYTVSSTIKTYTYISGVLNDSSVSNVNLVFPETESMTPYKVVGPDSVFFAKGGFTDIAASRIKTKPVAAKVIFEGNALLFQQNIFKDSTQNIDGTDYHIIQTGTAVIKLQKP